MIRRPPRSTLSSSSAASDVYKRQDIGLASKMSLRRSVANVNFIVRGLQQRLADSRGQALADDDRVAFAVLEALDANLLVFARHRRIRGAWDCDVGREIRLARERLGKIEAHARRRRLVVDLVIQDAKAVLLAQVFIDLSRVRVIAPLETY